MNSSNIIGFGFLCEARYRDLLFWVFSTILALSISVNIFCCVLKSGKRICRPRTKQRSSTRQMEENPIYGNLGYTQTSTTLFTDADPLQRVNSDSQSKSQDCYANLTLKPPRLQSGRSSPQVQYSEVDLLEEQSEKEEEGSVPEAVSNMSDLYASVQTQRTKTVQPANDGEEYANHL